MADGPIFSSVNYMEKLKSPFREGNYSGIVRVYGLLYLKVGASRETNILD